MRTASFLPLLGVVSVSLAADVQDCTCGFLDSTNGELYTDATIVYFNESTGLPEDFYAQNYAHKKESGWTTVFRSGALPANAAVGNSSSSSANWDASALQLFIDPSTKQHLINGASVESMRQDMLYGSFRAFMRGPADDTGGSAMSMQLLLNSSSVLEIDMLNGGGPKIGAKVSSLMSGEYPGDKTGLNYTVLASGSDKYAPIDPYDFIEVRMDWTKKFVNWTVAQNMSRSVNKKSAIPNEPMPLMFKHWSTGDVYYMGGPPNQRGESNVAWVRAFFNSSLSTKSDRDEYDSRCLAESKCNVDDISLRGSTSYSPQALIPWKKPADTGEWRVIAAMVCGASAALGVICLINVFFKRKPWKTMFNGESRYEPAELDLGQGLTSLSPYVLSFKEGAKKDSFESVTSKGNDHEMSTKPSVSPTEEDDTLADLDPHAGVRRRSVFRGQRTNSIPNQSIMKKPSVDVQETSNSFNNFNNFTFGADSKGPEVASYDFASQIPASSSKRKMSLFAQSRALYNDPDHVDETPVRDVRERQSSVFQSVAMSIVRLGSVAPTIEEEPEEPLTNEKLGEDRTIDIRDWNTQAQTDIPTIDPPFNAINKDRRPTIAEAVPIPSTDLPLAGAKAHERRVNYLAGLVAFSCLGVTGIHFTLTFVPYAGGLHADMHYKSEYWARWTVSPFILDPVWLGPIFVTSCRFLAGRFLRTGDLREVAIKMLLRAPRLLIPCIVLSMLQYFFIEEGVVSWITYLPSITWSSWPYVVNYKNFGSFMNDIIELAYLIPNAAPQILTHYCVGVLWTIPVQLQYSYTALLAVVIVRDIKTPYKRFLVYFIGIVTNWYALNWGSCFWAGILLADLQVTYKASTWLQAHKKVWYPTAVLLWLLALACPTMSLLEDRVGWKAMTAEHNIHPDFFTGSPIGDTIDAGYPRYFEPRLNTLIFAVCLQMIVETSTWVQFFLSLRFWQPIFPHAFTVYLIHGFVFWTLGAYMAVKLSIAGMPYWANMLVTAICCYIVLALVAIALGPLTEMANAAACRNIQRWATQAPVPDKPTLAPFPHDLFFSRTGGDNGGDEEVAAKVPETTAEEPQDGNMKRKSTLVTIDELPMSESSTSGSSSHGSNHGSSSGSSSSRSSGS